MKPIMPAGFSALSFLLALAIPATALAHPGVYSVDARIAKTAAKQTLTIDATGGTFKPSADATPVPYDATASQVLAALQADPAIGYDNVTVTGPDGGPFVLAWNGGALAGTAVSALVPDSSSLTGTTHTASIVVNSPGGANVTFGSDPAGASMATQKQYVVASDGFVLGFRETNGVAGGGLLNLKFLPSAYRAAMTPEQKIGYTVAQSGLQLHATCTGVAALANATNIYFTETRPTDGDPFYAYIPWQKVSAGFGDDPTKWIPAVKTITDGLPGAPPGGVDLAALSSVGDFSSACTALGGTYRPADTSSALATGLIAAAVDAASAPLNDQIGTLTGQVSTLTSRVSTLTAEVTSLTGQVGTLTTQRDAALEAKKTADGAATSAQAEVARLTRKLTVTATSPLKLAGHGLGVKLSGPPAFTALVRLVLSDAQAMSAHLKSRVIASTKRTIAADGSDSLTLKLRNPGTHAARVLAGKTIMVNAVSGDRAASSPVKVTR